MASWGFFAKSLPLFPQIVNSGNSDIPTQRMMDKRLRILTVVGDCPKGEKPTGGTKKRLETV